MQSSAASLPVDLRRDAKTMRWLLVLIGLLIACGCQGCRQGGLFGPPAYGYYGSYPVASPPVAYPAYTTNPCTCQ